MKAKCHVSLVQFAPRWCEREANAERMAAFAREEAERGADLIVFPELVNIGYNPVPPEPPTLAPDSEATARAARYVSSAEPVPGPTTQLLGAITRSYGNYIVVGIAQSHPDVPHTLFNAAVLLGPGGIVGVHHKSHPALQEKMYFYPGQTLDVYDTDIGKVGMLVCYDGRFPEAARVLTLKGAEIVVSIWASRSLGNFCPPEHFQHTAFTRAMENCNYFIACNRVGREGENVYSGHSAIGGPNGSIVAASETDQEEVVRAVLEEEQVLRARSVFPYFRDRRPDLYGKLAEPWLSPVQVAPPPTAAPETLGPVPGRSRARASR